MCEEYILVYGADKTDRKRGLAAMKVSNNLVEKQAALEELRSRKVGILLQIIDELECMNLSVPEIEAILKLCGLNADCAMRYGKEMRDLKKEAIFHSGNIALQ